MSSKVLIRGGCVLTLGARAPNYPQADVLIEDDRVTEVGIGLRARDAELVEATDTIVMPGFVDTHRHAWTSLFRNLGGASTHSAAVADHLEPDDVYAATLVGLLGAAEAGVTTVVDHDDVPGGAEHRQAALQAHADAGLRTVFVASDVPSAQSPLTTIAYGLGELLFEDLDRSAEEWANARQQGLRIHAHAWADPSNAGIFAELARRGLLGPDVTLVHCSGLTDADLDAIASSGAYVSLTPASEMAQGMGSPPMQGLIDRDIRPGLGVDDERVAPGDLFAQMRSAISLQHAQLFDRKLAGKAGVPQLLSTRDVIRYATVDGARVAGLASLTGSLEPGRQADIVILRTDRPNIFPVNDPIGAVVWGMDTSNVDWVFVAGRALMRNGVLEGDVERARQLALVAHHRVTQAAGLVAGSADSGGQ